jgi:hypothetical protein
MWAGASASKAQRPTGLCLGADRGQQAHFAIGVGLMGDSFQYESKLSRDGKRVVL